jgi:hypothetical protein
MMHSRGNSNKKASGNPCCGVTSTTTNTTCHPRLNPGLHGGTPASITPRHGTAGRILSRDGVTIDGFRIGNRLYWTHAKISVLSRCLYCAA